MSSRFKYNSNICNINNCKDSVHEHFMCKKHCNQYITDEKIKKISNNVELLNSGNASLSLKVKRIIQSIFHYSTDIPMLYEEHFPLEHIFLYHLFRLRGTTEKKHSEMLKNLINDFDIEQNENIDYVKNIYHNINIPKQYIKKDYILSRKELPNKYLLLISLLLLFALILLHSNSSLYLYVDESLMSLIPVFAKYSALYLIIILFFGEGFIYTYNDLSSLALTNNLFKEKIDNKFFLNDIKFIKDRRKKSDSYISIIVGSVVSIVTFSSYSIIEHSIFSVESWYLIVLLLLLINSIIVITFFYYNILTLFYPIIYSFEKKDISIRIYNPDCVGGTSIYQKYLFQCFIYNEAILVVSFSLMKQLPLLLCVFLFIILERRINHAGRSLFLYVKLMISIYNEKKRELNILISKNTPTALRNASLLKQVSPSLLLNSSKRIIVIIVLPLIISIAANKAEAILDFIFNLLEK